MITPSFSLTATERVLPRLALDWTTGLAQPGVDVTRAGVATFVGSNGLIQLASADTQRLDWSKGTAELLVEESRTNALTYSGFTGAVAGTPGTAPTGWSFVSSQGTTDSVTAGSLGGSDDNVVQFTATGNNRHYIGRTFSASANTTYVVSIYINANTNARPANQIIALASLPSGATVTYYNESGVSKGNGGTYYPVAGERVYLVLVVSATAGTPQIRVGVSVQSSGWNGTVAFSRIQLEAGAFPTSYIPTTTTAVTRNADVATITGTAFSGIWRSGPGSILVRALPSTVSGTRPLVQVDDATADNIIALRGNTTNPELYIRAGGSDQATIDAGTISAAAYRLAGSWKAGNGVATLNGFAPVKGTPASIPAATQMRLGSDGTNYLNGHLQSLEYWDEFLTPATLQSVTTSAGYRSIVGPVMRDTIIA